MSKKSKCVCYDYDRNANYNHGWAALQHICGLIERYNRKICFAYTMDEYNEIITEIRACCNMAKTCGLETRLYTIESLCDIPQICKIRMHNTVTGEVYVKCIPCMDYDTGFFRCLSKNEMYGCLHVVMKREFNVKGV